MNREIKFRVRRGALIIGYERLTPKGWEWMCPDLNPDSGERWTPGVIHSSTSDLLREQFTGFKDKRGAEVFDGDIIRYGLREGMGLPERKGLTRIIKTDHLGSIGWFDMDIIVLGDRHKNHELLTQFELS